ncbi:Bifunctional DNA primase/polymerase, N-terminal [Mycobacteroides abscessus subsp. abscessus]|uniref:AAA family ATPase n=1 Tax=Mycobacteroides abscessus TaxID=36809 RepID=UPI00092625A0|nr:AAA family ATPase [Mycobacteroides abscessus]SHP12881.1 Bifunctional DNA primase/polymerase, N-terminal [Mycobacteroides abscessus subsp. abscessus]SID51394.1 Bifunctional DNA primase/polymerase, N-terminal [Mycobacteroides abscessus subsp. abscessus]SKV53229.1 Bifunctional DNA primase/polymerase, N-terminal [Mycobacteroides abscessus subsp. abscessus]
MGTLSPSPDNGQTKKLTRRKTSSAATQTASARSLPDVSGLPLADAARAYGSAGLAVLPVNPARPKNPGSYVGKGWPDQSSTDAEQITAWWDRWPNASIAIHTGKSGLVAFDLDIDVLPDELAWMRDGLFQATRTCGERGHYVFATANTFVSGHLTLIGGTVVGEVRSGNSVIVAAPSPHHKAKTEGGQYRWHRPGVIPALPEAAHTYLRTSAQRLSAQHQGAAEPITDETVRQFLAQATGNSRPKALAALARKVSAARAGTRDEVRNALRIAAGEARTGLYPFADAVAEIESAARASYTERGDDFDAHIGSHEYNRLIVNGVKFALSRPIEDLRAEANRQFGTDHRDGRGMFENLDRILSTRSSKKVAGQPNNAVEMQLRERFSLESAFELSQPVPPMRWLVRNVWPENSAGVLAGEKKTFKSWNLQALALAVSSGLPYFGYDDFAVPNAAPVLYLAGEGGRDAFANRHQVIAARYGIGEADLPGLPFGAMFDTAELTDAELTDALARHLDQMQPALVIVDPLYAYHPSGVDTANLYVRGQMLAKVRELIEPYAALVIGDHFKKRSGSTGGTGSGAMDLDDISMSGISQWADSWGLQCHRDPPDITNNNYFLQVEFSTRRAGGRRYDIDWALNRDSNPDLVAWESCTWNVVPSYSAATAMLTRQGRAASAAGGRHREVMEALSRYVERDDLESAERGKKAVVDQYKNLTGAHGKRFTRAECDEALASLVGQGFVSVRKESRRDEHISVRPYRQTDTDSELVPISIGGTDRREGEADGGSADDV